MGPILRSYADLAVRFWVPLALVATAWELSSRSGLLPAYLLPSPSAISQSLIKLLESGSLVYHAISSVTRLMAGLCLGLPLGVIAAVVIHMNPKSLNWIREINQFLGQIPPVAWVHLTIAIAGIGDVSKVLLVAVTTFFIVFFNVSTGCGQISPRLLRVLKLYPNTKTYTATQIYFKGSLPYLISGLSLSMTIGWIVLIAAELVGSSNGLGWFVWDARNFGRTADMFAGLFVLGAIGVALTRAIDAYGAFALRWQGSDRSRRAGWSWQERRHQD